MAKLPTISSKIPPDLRQFLDRVREALEASGKDELVTAESLVASGLASWNGFTFSPLAPRYAAPTAPTNLETEGALTNVMLTWDKAPYEGHAYTEVWAAEQDPLKKAPPTLGDAELVGMAPGRFYAHEIGSGGKRYYWIRFVNINNDVGPYNATDGTVGETAPDPDYLLELLTGEITESQLYKDLGAKIGQISQNAADIISTQTIVNGLSEQVNTLVTSDGSDYSAVQTLAQSVDGVLGQYSVKIDTSGHVSGYGLISENINGDVQSAFGVRADTFWIAPEADNSDTAPTNNLYPGYVWNDTSTDPAVTKYYNGANWVEEPPNLPFVVRTTPTTINGVNVDPGVYIEAAYIADGTIGNAKIGNAAIDNAKIASLDAGKITTGYLSADRIEAESITAAKIDTRGLSIKDQDGNVVLAAGTPLSTDNISGLGALATISSVSYSNLDGDTAGLIDGKIDSWFQETDPSTPWFVEASGDDPGVDTRVTHLGDLWWHTTENKLYRYKYTEATEDTPEAYSWEVLTDQTAADAFQNAATAQDTADGKRRVFVSTFDAEGNETFTPTPPYDIGDLWDRGSKTGIWRCTADRATGYTPTAPATIVDDWQVVADRTSDNTAASITNQGAFATLDQITEDNITTYIDSAAISSAVIGDYIKSSLYNGDDNIANDNSNMGTQGWILDVASDRAVFNGNSIFKGVLDVKSNTSGARLEIKNDTIKVYDESGNLRVLIGSLV